MLNFTVTVIAKRNFQPQEKWQGDRAAEYPGSARVSAKSIIKPKEDEIIRLPVMSLPPCIMCLFHSSATPSLLQPPQDFHLFDLFQHKLSHGARVVVKGDQSNLFHPR